MPLRNTSTREFARLFQLAPKEASDYLRARGKLTKTFSWQDLWHDEHARQFTVSRLTRLDLLAAMQDGITKSVNGDLSRRDWTRNTKALLKKEGWWGEIPVIDPVSGETVTTKFDDARLKLIFDTNTRMAYSAGEWERIWRNRDTHPYVRYITRGDERVRESHRRWNNLTLPSDDPFWEKHWPPNGWRCRCRVTSMTQREYDKGYTEYRAAYEYDAEGNVKHPLPQIQRVPLVKEAPPEEFTTWTNQRTGEVSEVPVGVSPGFDYNPGLSRARIDAMNNLVRDKLAAAPPPLAKAAVADGMEETGLKGALDRVAEEIVGEPVEHLVLLDKNGNELARALGDEDMVNLPEDMLAQLADGILLHNHPGSPQSFTVDDIKLAVWHELAATHVVDREFRYSATRPPDISWGPAYWVGVLEPVVSRVEDDVTKRLDETQASGLISLELRSAIEAHMIWEEVNAEVTIGYQRLRRRNDGS